MNKRIAFGALLACTFATVNAQEKDYTVNPAKEYVFSTVKELKITPIKSQGRTGTCWCFSGISFLESELIRKGKGEYDLSEMFVVNHTYREKAERFVRLHGELNFGQGGAFSDPLYVLKNYGLVPNEVMTGLQYGEDTHVHGEMESIATAYVSAVVKNPNRKLTPKWEVGYKALIDSYPGELPETFKYNGKEYTPKSFASELEMNADDYVSLTSFTHHPFYSSFAIEVPDNWLWTESYNLPIEELIQTMDNAIQTGYSIAWATDVSEKGFTRDGIAVMPDIKAMETAGSDQARWVGLSTSEKDKEINKMLEGPCPEVKVTQELRQQAYDNYQTTDDHGMHIYGIAKDQTGKEYYMVKNSWGETGKYKGVWYASKAFVAYKTLNIVVHKDALPKKLKNKLGIK